MIHGLSDTREWSRGGKIRLGEKVKNAKGTEFPKKIDYFRFDPDDESLIKKWVQEFGEKPKRIPVVFAGETIEKVFPQFYDLYGTSGLMCRGDGKEAKRIIDGSNKMEPVECPGPNDCPYAKQKGRGGKPGCKAVGRLQFFIPGLPVLQVFQIDTGSIHSIIAVNSGLDLLHRIAGRIDLVPVVLTLKDRQVREPGGKKVTIYCLGIDFECGVDEVVKLQPILLNGQDRIEAPPVSNAIPEDLYPRSQVTPELPAPAEEAAPVEEDPRKALWKRAVKIANAAGVNIKELKAFFVERQIESFEKADVALIEIAIDELEAYSPPSLDDDAPVDLEPTPDPEPPEDQQEIMY